MLQIITRARVSFHHVSRVLWLSCGTL